MSSYLPVIISAVLIIAILLWWLLALDGVKTTGGPSKDVASPPPVAVPAPPVTPVAKAAPAPKLMDDPTPATKTAKAQVQAPLKAAATKAAPTPVAKPVAAKVKTAKAPAPEAAPKAAPKTATPKVAAKPVAAKVKAEPVPKPAPKAVVVKAEAAPKPKGAKAAPKAKVSIPDNLELLKGVGPKVNNMLKSLGVTSFAQVASWTAADIAEIDGKLGAFAGRISRDNWIDQAKLLVAGDVAGFEKKYGALGSEVAKG